MFMLKNGKIIEERSLISRMRRRIGNGDAELQELLISFTSFFWGLMILLTHNMTEAFNKAPSLHALVLIFPDHIWGFILSIIGFYGLFAYVKDYKLLRRVSAIVNTFFYTLMAFLVWIHPSPVIGVIIIPLLSITSFLTLLRQKEVVYFKERKIKI